MNKRRDTLWLLLAVLASPLARAAEPTVDGVLAVHAAARGGRERWQAVATLEVRGVFTAFSRREPFLLLNQGPELYRFETAVSGMPTTYARGPGGTWWIEPFLGVETAQRPIPGYVRQLDRAFQMTPGLLLAAARGDKIELAGPGDVDGEETLTLRVTPAEGDPEVWHLDPETWLEVAVDSRVLDYTQKEEPMDQRAYFSDFREVGGLVLPYRVEREYLSRHTVLEIEDVKVDAPLADERFAMPAATDGS